MKKKLIVSMLLLTATVASAATFRLYEKTAKTALAGDDIVGIEDSAATWDVKKVNLETLKSYIKPSYLPEIGPTADNQILQATGAGTAVWTNFIEGLINDEGDSWDDLLSAHKIYDTFNPRKPTTLELNADYSPIPSQIVSYETISNYSSTSQISINFPSIDFRITRTILVESPFEIKLYPPPDESFVLNGVVLNTGVGVVSPNTEGSKINITRRRVSTASFVYDINTVIGTWTATP